MPGAKRKKAGARPSRADWKVRAVRGLTPWTPDGLVEAFARWQELVGEAFRRARTSRTGGVSIRLPIAKMRRHFTQRYGEQEGSAHFLRWVKIGDFLAAHRERLEADGLLQFGPGGSMEMAPALIESLCAVRFRRTRTGRVSSYSIALADVRRRMK